MDKYRFFWDTMELCNWELEGEDDKVLAPVAEYLSGQEDHIIFLFDDLMAELLYQLDTRELAGQCEKAGPYMSDDTFLYSRCVALINGPQYYEKAKHGNCPEMWAMEFEALLYVPQRAWAFKHRKNAEDYPHVTPLSYETGSNRKGWE